MDTLKKHSVFVFLKHIYTHTLNIYLPPSAMSLFVSMHVSVIANHLFIFILFCCLISCFTSRFNCQSLTLVLQVTSVNTKNPWKCQIQQSQPKRSTLRVCIPASMCTCKGHTSRPPRDVFCFKFSPVSRETEGKHSFPVGCSCERCVGLLNSILAGIFWECWETRARLGDPPSDTTDPSSGSGLLRLHRVFLASLPLLQKQTSLISGPF